MIDRGAVLPASVRGSDIPSAGKTAPPIPSKRFEN